MNTWDYSLSAIVRSAREVEEVRNGRQDTAKKCMKQFRRKERLESALKPMKHAIRKLRSKSERSDRIKLKSPGNIEICTDGESDSSTES